MIAVEARLGRRVAASPSPPAWQQTLLCQPRLPPKLTRTESSERSTAGMAEAELGLSCHSTWYERSCALMNSSMQHTITVTLPMRRPPANGAKLHEQTRCGLCDINGPQEQRVWGSSLIRNCSKEFSFRTAFQFTQSCCNARIATDCHTLQPFALTMVAPIAPSANPACPPRLHFPPNLPPNSLSSTIYALNITPHPLPNPCSGMTLQCVLAGGRLWPTLLSSH